MNIKYIYKYMVNYYMNALQEITNGKVAIMLQLQVNGELETSIFAHSTLALCTMNRRSSVSSQSGTEN